MNRDCGKGKLEPHRWFVKSCPDRESDREVTKNFPDRESAETEWERLAETLRPCANVRLYVADQAGYANCVMSKFITADGKEMVKDRRNEV